MTKKVLIVSSLVLVLFSGCNFFQKYDESPLQTTPPAVTPPPAPAEPSMPPAGTPPVTSPTSTSPETIMPLAETAPTTSPPTITPPTPMPKATPPPPPPPPATLETKVINMTSGNLFFKPSGFTVKKNQPVKIILSNTGIHTFTLDAFSVNVSLTGSSGVAIFTPTKTGTFQYYCAIGGHAKAGMVGTMTVTE